VFSDVPNPTNSYVGVLMLAKFLNQRIMAQNWHPKIGPLESQEGRSPASWGKVTPIERCVKNKWCVKKGEI